MSAKRPRTGMSTAPVVRCSRPADGSPKIATAPKEGVRNAGRKRENRPAVSWLAHLVTRTLSRRPGISYPVAWNARCTSLRRRTTAPNRLATQMRNPPESANVRLSRGGALPGVSCGRRTGRLARRALRRVGRARRAARTSRAYAPPSPRCSRDHRPRALSRPWSRPGGDGSGGSLSPADPARFRREPRRRRRWTPRACETLADAFALVVAFTVDPSVSRRQPPPVAASRARHDRRRRATRAPDAGARGRADTRRRRPARRAGRRRFALPGLRRRR